MKFIEKKTHTQQQRVKKKTKTDDNIPKIKNENNLSKNNEPIFALKSELLFKKKNI